jgi:hypothetical protein
MEWKRRGKESSGTAFGNGASMELSVGVGFAPLVFQNCHKMRRFPEEVVSASLREQESFNGKLLFPGKSQCFAFTLQIELPLRHVQAMGRL